MSDGPSKPTNPRITSRTARLIRRLTKFASTTAIGKDSMGNKIMVTRLGARMKDVGAAIGGAGWILYVDRILSFFGDDWTFVVNARRDWPSMLLTPHNGHWTLVHSALYEALFVTVGLRSYLPYLALMLAAHAACVV